MRAASRIHRLVDQLALAQGEWSVTLCDQPFARSLSEKIEFFDSNVNDPIER